jgi:PadR family transcriptional regulator AphA
MKKLSTTSFAILGLLAIRPWTTYELTQQLRRNLHYFWPRAESGVYEEPRNLVRHGLAESRREVVGRRPRTVYTITSAGRAALAEWLDLQSEPSTLFSEALVRLWFADQGTEATLQHAIHALRQEAQTTIAQLLAIAHEYAEAEQPPFPERLPINALAFRYVLDHAQSTLHWAGWAEACLEQWSEDGRQNAAWNVFREAAGWSQRMSPKQPENPGPRRRIAPARRSSSA